MYELIRNAFLYTKTDMICVIMLFLVIIKIYGWRKKDIFMKLYFLIVVSSQFMVTAFAIGHLADYGVLRMNESIRYFFVIISFVAFGLTIFLWFIYSGIFRESPLISNKTSYLYCAIPLFVYFFIVILSCYIDSFYYVSANGVFKKGPYFEVLFVIPAAYMLFAGFALLRDALDKKNAQRRKRYGILAAFMIPVFFGCIIQNMLPESNMLTLGVCIGVLIAYMSLSVDEVAQEVIRKNIELEYSQAELRAALEDEKRQHNIVGSLANIYVFMYYIHMRIDEYDEIKKNPLVSEMAGDTRSASEALNRLFSNLPISNHINMMLEFTDLSTLDKRM